MSIFDAGVQNWLQVSVLDVIVQDKTLMSSFEH